MCEVTVFTPTFNRYNTLSRLYESLKKQTNKNFEWIIVDDGSTDNTKKMIEIWSTESKDISISYYYQVNSGKHVAINLGVKKAKGRLFFIVDSDDFLSCDAIEKIIDWSRELSDNGNYGGIVGNKANFHGNIIGTTFKDKKMDLTFLERIQYGISGDKAEVFFLDVIRNYPFPVFEGEKFCTEALVWNRMAQDNIKFRFFNEVIYYVEYLDDGLSSKYQFLMKNNPQQAYIYYKELYFSFKYFGIKYRILHFMNCIYFGSIVYNDFDKLSKNLKSNIMEIYVIFILNKIYRKVKRLP